MGYQLVLSDNVQNYKNDLSDLLRAYGVLDEAEGKIIALSQRYDSGEFFTEIKVDGRVFSRTDNYENAGNSLVFKRMSKRYAKLLLYEALCNILGKSLPWGSLTGIRPTAMLHELGKEGKSLLDFEKEFGVSKEKCALSARILKNQCRIRNKGADDIDLYINIPFCVSRCSYCSFISAIISQKKRWISPYIDALLAEYRSAVALVKRMGKRVCAVYVGGGTPTSLNDEDFARVMQGLTVSRDFPDAEYTVEAGRPDTITRAKLIAMQSAGVGRISINPQTFNDRTLQLIGRNHSADQTVAAYKMAREYPFVINMDLIAALPGESVEDFCRSVDRTIELSPDNVTVHTLAIKRSSMLSGMDYDNREHSNAVAMTDYAQRALMGAGYEPYYLYRQKNMNGNQENVGYMKSGSVCIYNVDNMEELCSVLAIGAGGISKRITGSRIERMSNIKNIEEYVRLHEEIIKKREEFFLEGGNLPIEA